MTHASRYPAPVMSLGLAPDCGTLAVGLADGTLALRKHDRPRALAAGTVGARPARRERYRPRLTAANFRCALGFRVLGFRVEKPVGLMVSCHHEQNSLHQPFLAQSHSHAHALFLTGGSPSTGTCGHADQPDQGQATPRPATYCAGTSSVARASARPQATTWWLPSGAPS